jgi:hypothetical protein
MNRSKLLRLASLASAGALSLGVSAAALADTHDDSTGHVEATIEEVVVEEAEGRTEEEAEEEGGDRRALP